MTDPFATMPNSNDSWNGEFSPAAATGAPAPAPKPVTMGIVSARGLLKAHGDDARQLTKLTKSALARIDIEELAKQGGTRIYGNLSKQEMISDILEMRYPIADRHQAIHVTQHVDGLTNSVCEWCFA